MKVVKVWWPAADTVVYRVVSDERAEIIKPLVHGVMTPEEFVEELSNKGAFELRTVQDGL